MQNLTKAYGAQTLLEDVSFTVAAGERVGMVGRNGHGKTTLLRMILGKESPDAGSIDAPSGYTYGHLSQHISFGHDTVLNEACAALGVNEDGWVETYRAETILAGLGFSDEDVSGPPERLSGGFQVRLNLVKVLLAQPSMLLLDEPTNYLDITSRRWLEGFLRAWKGEMLLVTHDRIFMDEVCTHTLAIHRRGVRKVKGPTAKLYDQIALDEEVYARTLANEAKKRELAESFINRFRYKATKARQVQSKLKALERMGERSELADIPTLDFQFIPAPLPGRRVLDIEGLEFRYGPDSPELIRGLSFSIGPRDRIAVVGPNGRGKTTLMSLLAGELVPADGSLAASPNLRVGYFGQTNVDRLDPDKTVEQEISGAMAEQGHTTARGLAGKMMFEGDHALKKIHVLSGGERSRVLLAKILARPASLLLLDEPSDHLDMQSVETLADALDVFEGSVVIVTHDEAILEQVATRLVVFDAGAVRVFEGGYADFLDKVGWSSEATVRKSTKVPLRPGDGEDRQDDRRRRAAELTARRKTLAPLEREVARMEGRIADLETRETELHEALAAAATNPTSSRYQDLAWELRDVHNARDQTYTRLERAEATLAERQAELASET